MANQIRHFHLAVVDISTQAHIARDRDADGLAVEVRVPVVVEARARVRAYVN